MELNPCWQLWVLDCTIVEKYFVCPAKPTIKNQEPEFSIFTVGNSTAPFQLNDPNYLVQRGCFAINASYMLIVCQEGESANYMINT